MTKNEEPAQPDIPEDALIGTPSRPSIRLRGSHSSQQEMRAVTMPLRRRQDDGGDDDPPPPPPPPPPVSTPDLAIQISPCLAPFLEGALVSAVRAAIDPNADVRPACINGIHRVGIWLRPFLNESDNQARSRGLQRLNFIGAGETLAFFVNSALIRRQAMDGWNAMPKRRNGDGDPDPNGPVHLTSFAVDFESPNRVITRVGGFDERPWPDVDFQLTITDTLSVSGGQVHSQSTRNLNVDTTWLSILAGLFLPLFLPLSIVFLTERIIVGSKDAPNVDAGAGGAAVALIPREILIPLGQKVVASYSRVVVFDGGIVAGGSFMVIARMPAVTVAGDSQLSVHEGTASVTRAYSLRTEDLRPQLQIAWTGQGTALSPSAVTTNFRFNLGNAAIGDVLTRRVAVRVTDADNLSATGEMVVSIYVTSKVDDGGLPPICRIKPWLPQCQV